MFEAALRRFARIVTVVVAARPGTWRFFRPVFTRQWNRLAASWDRTRKPDSYAPIAAALETLPADPARALDVGTGTGGAAFVIADRFPRAQVTGVDLAEAMVARASAKIAPAAAGRLSFQQADGSALPFADDAFDLVTCSNMIPFFDEVARVVRPGGMSSLRSRAAPRRRSTSPPLGSKPSCAAAGSRSSRRSRPGVGWRWWRGRPGTAEP